jgi:hypothetical protein
MPSLVTSETTSRPSATGPNRQQGGPLRANHQFIAMLDAFRRSGGLAQAYEVVALFLARGDADISSLAQRILQRKVISIEWQSKIWLPLFQFNRDDMTPQPGLAPVLTELNPVYPAWDMAHWFSRPHPWLDGHTPADTLRTDATAVLNAAHFDRLIAVG